MDNCSPKKKKKNLLHWFYLQSDGPIHWFTVLFKKKLQSVSTKNVLLTTIRWNSREKKKIRKWLKMKQEKQTEKSLFMNLSLVKKKKKEKNVTHLIWAAFTTNGSQPSGLTGWTLYLNEDGLVAFFFLL